MSVVEALRGSRARLAAVVLVGVLAVAGLVALARTPSDAQGDPGQAILNQLRPVANALPANLHIDYSQYDEPHLDSCDGNASTQGWDPVVVQIAVEVPGASGSVVAAVARYLESHGWTATANPTLPWIWPPGSGWNWPNTGEWKWTSTLAGGRPALADFSNGGLGSQWILFAEAPSTLKPPTGC